VQNSASIKTGVLLGLAAAVIWGGWPVVTALGIQDNITPYELVLIRVVVAGLILLPFAFKGDNNPKVWVLSFVFTLFSGATYSITSASGYTFSSASHGGSILPGTVMLVGLLASHFFLHEKLTRARILGSFSIILGLFLLFTGASAEQTPYENSWIGDSLFVLAGIMWGLYTFLLRLWPMDPVTVTARVSFLSLIMVALYQALFSPQIHLLDLPIETLALQIVWQGLLSAVIAIIMFNKAVAILGAARAAVLNAFIPVVSIILTIIVLDEIPTLIEWLGLIAIIGGIAMAIRSKKVQDKTNIEATA